MGLAATARSLRAVRTWSFDPIVMSIGWVMLGYALREGLGRVGDAQRLTQGVPPFLEKIIIRVLQHLEMLVSTQ